MADTTLMSIPGQIDPVPVARDITPREDGRVDLIGLPKDRIRELFAEAGLDAKAGKAAREAGVSLALPSRRHRLCRHDRYRQDHAPLAGGAFRHRAARGGRGAAFDRRHAQMAAENRRRARIRDGLHSRRRPRDLVRFQPGRLHAQLPVLPHRHHAAGAQSDAGRDRRAGDAGARCAGRMAERIDVRPRRCRGRGTLHIGRPPADQHRHDGHGRTAV